MSFVHILYQEGWGLRVNFHPEICTEKKIHRGGATMLTWRKSCRSYKLVGICKEKPGRLTEGWVWTSGESKSSGGPRLRTPPYFMGLSSRSLNRYSWWRVWKDCLLKASGDREDQSWCLAQESTGYMSHRPTFAKGTSNPPTASTFPALPREREQRNMGKVCYRPSEGSRLDCEITECSPHTTLPPHQLWAGAHTDSIWEWVPSKSQSQERPLKTRTLQ